ncbi:MAG: hypothetical protein NVSMB25_22250 [Thermoleophilaceae bacterium]
MAILTTFKIIGDPDELLALKKEHVDPVTMELAPKHGGISHTVVKTSDGLMMLNLWQDETGMNEVADHVAPIAQKAGLPRPQDHQQYEVLQHETPNR